MEKRLYNIGTTNNKLRIEKLKAIRRLDCLFIILNSLYFVNTFIITKYDKIIIKYFLIVDKSRFICYNHKYYDTTNARRITAKY